MNIFEEDCLSISQLCKILPVGRNGKRPTFSTVWRYVLEGAKLPNGERVKLEAVRFGGKWVSSKQAAQRFVEALSSAAADVPSPFRGRPARNRAAEQAAAELSERGI